MRITKQKVEELVEQAWGKGYAKGMEHAEGLLKQRQLLEDQAQTHKGEDVARILRDAEEPSVGRSEQG
jgi:hypothetical protein